MKFYNADETGCPAVYHSQTRRRYVIMLVRSTVMYIVSPST